MAMQPPDPLQQHIHRAQVGDQQVSIKIEALFQRLGADQQHRPDGGTFAEPGADRHQSE